jgi:hypothetical protein
LCLVPLYSTTCAAFNSLEMLKVLEPAYAGALVQRTALYSVTCAAFNSKDQILRWKTFRGLLFDEKFERD